MMQTVAVKTVDGGVLELQCSHNGTIGDVCDVLINQFGYRKNVRLMFGGAVLDARRYVDEFPNGSMIVVGTRAPVSPCPPAAATAASPARAAPTSSAPPPGPSPRRSPSISPTRKTVPADHIKVTVLQASNNAKHSVYVHRDATVADLMTHVLAKEPSLRGNRLLFHGHEMNDMSSEIRRYGVNDGAVVHAAARNVDPITLKLDDAERQLSEMAAMYAGGTTEQQRKGLYEQSMRLLFSLDGLEVEGNTRLRRKELVKQITAFQDRLGVSP